MGMSIISYPPITDSALRGLNGLMYSSQDDVSCTFWLVSCLVKCLTTDVTHYKSYWSRSSESIIWQVLAKLNGNTTKYS